MNEVINECCPLCKQPQDVSKFSPEHIRELEQLSAISEISLKIFEFVSQVAESGQPLMTKLVMIDYDTGQEEVIVDLWAGFKETPITRLEVKNARILELENEISRLKSD